MTKLNRITYLIWNAKLLNTAYWTWIFLRLKFRADFINNCGVCPFTEAVTIASACNKLFRRRFLKPNSIGILPRNNYRLNDNQSRIGLQWLIWMEHTLNFKIAHAGHQKEVVLFPGIKVDGYYAPQKLVFEFHGCYYHGHDLCYRTNREKPLFDDSRDTMASRFSRTNAKTAKLRALGYTVNEMWECEFRTLMKINVNIRKHVENHPLINFQPLEPRDAFFGGRTGNTRLYYCAAANETIKYYDVCSLYPAVCKYGKYPVGHPNIYVGDKCNVLLGPDFGLEKVEGLIKCSILPPSNLYHPVLPLRAHNKLMFILCRACGTELTQADCSHTDDERTITGTWVSDEIKKAVSLGYKIIEIFEIWQYDIIKYDPISKSGGLFSEYINTFLKIKQEASGFTNNCTTNIAKENYIKEYIQNEGILLDMTNIEKNAGKRSLAKLNLNSFWGKLGQRENQPKTFAITHERELYDLLSNPAIEVNHVLPCSENRVYANYEYVEEAAESLPTVNVVLAAYTTAQARLRLYDILYKLDNRVLYYDTDSVIFTSKKDEYEPPTGNFLGNLTDELECYGAGTYITEFVSGGPKNYAYKLQTPTGEVRTICKIKGFTLNYQNLKKLNFDVLKNMIVDSENNPNKIVIQSDSIRITKDHSIVTRKETKTFCVNFMKRRRYGDYNSLPYGYKKQKTV